ncbi:heme lyase CcmF/NrfE family subunit [Ferrimonas marina]|uniref:Cytochrome c-type biogenesis protein CcmF n=1 Tax=Ferrimonas marina TaxID=299255 RepID=A0A1M5X7G1_9GAMM|nr:heme lyase CcmF/NrfE family subunit [Ferrimonas marina]SHH95706.1 cytochrome c-type biogenesis protein CcmF [Ferrimonas marina]
MIPEIGHVFMILGLLFALALSVIPMWGAARQDAYLISYRNPLTYGMFVSFAMAIFILGYCFYVDDFSVAYVAGHSNSQLPLIFKLAAVWGGHEGSLLFWVFSIAIWAAAIALLGRNLEAVYTARVLSVLGMITAGFALFALLTSNPFDRILPEVPMDGQDLNPMLQDIGLVFHPPALYLGYVGFSVTFAFAIAALMSGRLDAAWARWSRPWTLAAWIFLTAGNALGSWWAYYELGWGGWWFWDPVENASFMPWIVGTALLHSLIVTEKRGTFRNWTILLAICAFSLTLLGTFIVRSGIITSVHAFAADPARGMFILALLGLSVGGSFLLFALRASDLLSPARFELLSRESALLIGNVLLMIATASVLLGTLYPVLLDSLGGGQVSVGPPYFNAVFNPIALTLFVLMGLTLFLRWRRTEGRSLIPLLLPAGISLAAGIAVASRVPSGFTLWVVAGIATAVWLLLTHGLHLFTQLRNNDGWTLQRLNRSYMGMWIAHIGVAASVFGATMVSWFETERSVQMGPGYGAELAGYTFVYDRTLAYEGSNYSAKQGVIRILDSNERHIATVTPQRNTYHVRGNTMTKQGIDWGLTRDLYVAMGDPIDRDLYAVRLSYKPFVRWIWIGSLLMMVGAGLAISAHARVPTRRHVSQPVATAAA